MTSSLFGPFLKGISGFGGFALVNQAGAFFLIPVYWQYLDPGDYGVIGIYTIVVSVLSALFTFGLNGTIERYYYEWAEKERPVKIRILSYIQILLMIIFAGAVHLIFCYDVIEFRNANYSPVVMLAITTASFLSLQYIPFSLLRVTQRVKVFGSLSILSFFMTALITIFSLAYAGLGLEGYLYSQFISSGLMALVWIIFIDNNSSKGRWVSVIEELKFAAPNLPLTAITRLSEIMDRVILERFLTLNAFGIYVVAHRFGGYVGSVNSVLKLAFYPLIFKKVIKDKGNAEEVSQLSLFYVFLFAQLGLLVMVFFEGVVFWFGDKKFYGAFDYIPYFIIASFIRGLATAFGVGIELAKVPHKALYAVIPSSLIAVVLAIILIPSMGIVGAIITLITSAVVKSIISIYLGHKAYPRSFPLGKLSLILSIDGLMVWGICTFRIETFGEIAFKVTCVLMISLVLFILLYKKDKISFGRIVSLKKTDKKI